MLKNGARIIIKFFTILFVLLIALIVVNLIPRKYIEKNVIDSVDIIKAEGNFPKVKFTYNYLLDNYTDALMINTAYSVDSNEPVKSAILMRRNYRPNEGLELEKIDNENNTINNLNETLEGTNTTYYEYSRYWHGYMMYLRPLLVLFNYSQIRVILQLLIIVISIILMYVVYKYINISTSIATLFMLIVANFYFIGMSLQYSSVFIIMLFSSIYITVRYKKIKRVYDVFFIIGMLTSFFDLLTTPLLTLGIPVIYYIILRNKENKQTLKSLFITMISWGLGYGVMWASKWIISDCICQTGTISRALQKITLLSTDTNQVNPRILEVFNKNIMFVNATFVATLIAVTILLTLMNRKNIKQKIPYIIVAALPFIWYMLIKNHSFIHARFTWRNLLLTIFVLTIITMTNISEYLNSSKKNMK